MKCEICGAEVNNPNHQSHINSKRHQDALSESKPLVRNDPAKLNILINSARRCGMSWFCRVLSLVHFQMFGDLKKWNIRTSRLSACRKNYPAQKGWNTVL